jgi:hypothetical protein|tara:strand:+ start:1527 stop:1766 length:240 start_codon:yes stop_codon:yes gene_type:complete
MIEYTGSERIARIKALADVLWELTIDIEVDTDYNMKDGTDAKELLYSIQADTQEVARNLNFLQQMAAKREKRFAGVYEH